MQNDAICIKLKHAQNGIFYCLDRHRDSGLLEVKGVATLGDGRRQTVTRGGTGGFLGRWSFFVVV